MLNIKSDLKKFYDQEAKKYYQTRKKHWSDWEFLLKLIKNNKQKNIKILELGCWSWRFCTYLNKNYNGNFEYIGVDISEKLLNFAKQDNPNNQFFCDDMVNFTQNINIDSFDYVISIASFQHIPNKLERNKLIGNCYKILKKWWKFISINWSFSLRFLKKYFFQIVKSFLKYLIVWNKNSRNNIYIPRKVEEKIFYRFYHIFTLKELKILLKKEWFYIENSWYLNKQWLVNNSRTRSKNSIIIWLK